MFALFLILAIMAILGQAFLISKQKEGFLPGDDPITLFGENNKIPGLKHISQNGNVINQDNLMRYDVSLSTSGIQYFDIWHMADDDSVPNVTKIKNYLNDTESSLMHDVNVSDISGFLIGCAKAVADADLTYGEISETGCRGGNNISNGKRELSEAEQVTDDNDDNDDNKKGKLLTFDAKKLVEIIQEPKVFTAGSDMLEAQSCSIVYDNAKDGWVCASNCLIKKDDSIDKKDYIGNIKRGGNVEDGDLGDIKERYHMPLYGKIKHGSSYEFQCDSMNDMHSLPQGARTEPRKCSFGKLNVVTPKEQLKCDNAREVPKCQVITNIDDVRCLSRTFTDGDSGKRYRYCPIVCNNTTGDKSGGACQADQDCAGHLHKHDVSDKVKQVPHKHPIAGVNDNIGYTRIQVDSNDNPSNINLNRNNSQIYGDLMISQTMNPDGEKDVNVSALEKTTIGGLFDHVLNKMPVKNIKNFITGLQSYFTTSPLELKEQTQWMNDHSGYGLDGSTVEGGLKNAPFTSAGHHLSISQLADPTNFKNNNQYIAQGREILYERKRAMGKENRSLNPEGIPKHSLAALGKTEFNIKKITKELNNEYLKPEKKRSLRKQLLNEKDKQTNLINVIELAEENYESILNVDNLDSDGKPVQASYIDIVDGTRKFLFKEDGKPAIEKTDGKRGGMLGFKQNDEKYIPFRTALPKYYRTENGEYLQTPESASQNIF